MNMTMDVSSMASLKHRVLFKIALKILDDYDTQKAISESFCTLKQADKLDLQSSIELVKEELQTLQCQAWKGVSRLSLPNLLKNELLQVVEDTVWQLFKWKDYSLYEKGYDRKPSTFSWTPKGTLDKDKSVELYINFELLPVDDRFAWACLQCLEDDIFMLWKQIGRTQSLKSIRAEKPPIMSFWIHYMEGKLHRLSGVIRRYCRLNDILPFFSLNEYMFHFSVIGGHLAATRYFFQKLTSEQKEKLLLPSAIYSVAYYDNSIAEPWQICLVCLGECFAKTSAFLISNLNKEQQKEMFRNYPYYALMSFLIWPRQTLFMKQAKTMFCSPNPKSTYFTPGVQYYSTLDVWNFSPKVRYFRVLKMMAFKILSDSTEYNYRELFAEFWLESHNTYKNYVIKKCKSDAILSAVFKIEKTENIQLVVKDEFFSRKNKTFYD